MPGDILALRAELGLPELVQERRYPPIHYWGIECPDAWLDIVFDAVTAIEVLLNDILASGVAVQDLPACVQIKEKFGRLQIYWRAVDASRFTPAMRDAISIFEDRVLALQG
jgi:hypothetical protein